MTKELAFVLINPYTIAKSRTGGVIARFIGRTNLNLVAARMMGPCRELVERYAELVRNAETEYPETSKLIANYILNSYMPDPVTGKPRRVMLLLFEGEDAVQKIWNLAGSATLRWGSGETIRDTYGDYILDDQNNVQYFEPAVLVAPTKKRVGATLSLWAKYSVENGGIVESGKDVPEGVDVQRTLVLLKPDNFRFPSFRPGNIIDLLSSSGLRIVGIKKFCMTVAQAEEFYEPVKESLIKKFKKNGTERVARTLTREFGFNIPETVVDSLCSELAPLFGSAQFDNIVKFMTGYKHSECSDSEKKLLGKENCLALVYEGVDAVKKIRAIVGSTNPSEARPGSVRKEFGSDIMVNAAHASDSTENAEREMNIIKVEKDTIKAWLDKYYGNFFSQVILLGKTIPRVRGEFSRKVRKVFK